MEARDNDALLSLFAPDATWTADGGGKTAAAPRPIAGAERIARLVIGLREKFWADNRRIEIATINGETGLCIRDGGRLTATLSIATDGGADPGGLRGRQPRQAALSRLSQPRGPGVCGVGAGHTRQLAGRSAAARCRPFTSSSRATKDSSMNSPRIDVNTHLVVAAPARDVPPLDRGHGGLDKRLFTLVKIRASQINGCAYCIDMHTKEARAAGETEQRIYALSAWRETPFFSERERAALDWTETVTLVADTHVPDDVYARASAQFGGAGTPRADLRRHRDQQLEPPVGRVPAGGRQLSAQERGRGGLTSDQRGAPSSRYHAVKARSKKVGPKSAQVPSAAGRLNVEAPSAAAWPRECARRAACSTSSSSAR